MVRRFGVVRGLGVVSVAALLAASLVAPPASARPTDIPDMPTHCRSAYKSSVQWKADVRRVASERVLTFDGRRVELRGRGWEASSATDPSWTLWFHSLVWLVPIALDDTETAVDVFIERDRALPDPGLGVDKSTSRSMGWTQGQFRTRLEVATCLYLLTDDERLRPIADRLAEANMDSERYPGPPNFPVHNHGAMSNVALMQAGKVFGEQGWIDLALSRFKRDMPDVFEACGMMFEQASTYQLHNVRLYEKAARLLGTTLGAPNRALGALVRPDGILEAIGDGQESLGLTPNGESLWCPKSGWAAGTVEGMHFTLRFGPSARYHGHRDHGGMTWFAFGIPVLSDRGLFDKDRGERYSYAHDMRAHSVFEPIGHRAFNPETWGTRQSATSFSLGSTDDGLMRNRRVSFSPTRLVVRDEGSGAKEWTQHWQLAPGWSPTKSGAKHASGASLTIDCPNLKAVKVESYPTWRTVVPAWDLQCKVESKSSSTPVKMTTTLTVTPATDG